MASSANLQTGIDQAQARDPGLRPLPWPPWSGGQARALPTRMLAAVWVLSLLLALGLGHLSVEYPWFNYPAGGWRLGIYPPWTIAVLWTLWAGWAYGAVLSCVCALVLSLKAGFGFGSIAIALADPAGLGVLYLFLRGFYLDTRVRYLRDAGILIAAIFFAAITGSLGAFAVAAGRSAAGNEFTAAELLVLWEGWWLGHFVEGLVLAAPLAACAGPSVERWKALRFACPPRTGAWHTKMQAAAICGAALIVFYSVWLQLAGARVEEAMLRWVADPAARLHIQETYRVVALQQSLVVATLMGLAGVGVWVALGLHRRLAERAREEARRDALSALRWRVSWAAAPALAESEQAGPDAPKSLARFAEVLAQADAPGAVSVYLRDPHNPASLQLACHAEADAQPPPADLPAALPLDACLCGQAMLEGGALAVEKGLERHPLLLAHSEYVRRKRPQCAIAVPIAGKSGVRGALLIFTARSFGFEEADRRLYQLIGRSAGAALERAEEQLKARVQAEEWGALYHFARVLSGVNDPGTLLQRVAEEVRILQGAECAVALLAEPREGHGTQVAVAAVSASPEVVAPPPGATLDTQGTGLVAACMREGRPQSAGLSFPTSDAAFLAPGWSAAGALALPLMANEKELTGVLVLTFPAGRPIGPAEIGMAEELARQASADLRRVRLLEESRRQAAEIALFDQIGRALSEHLSLADTLKRVVENVSKVFPAEWATVLEYEADSEILATRVTTIGHPEAAAVRLPLSANSLASCCFREGTTLVSPDTQLDPRSNPELKAKFKTGSAVAVPLGPSGARFGVLLALNPFPRNFGADEIRRLEQVAALASAALERARLHEEVRRRAEDLALLNEVGAVLVETPLLESSLRHIAEIVRRYFQVAGAGFLLVDSARKELAVHGASGWNAASLRQVRVPLSMPGVTTAAFLQQQTIAVEDARTDPRVGPLLGKLLPGIRSGVAVPMQAARGPVGILGIYHDRKHRFEERDLQRLKAVARLAAAAVERGELGQALKASEARLQEVFDGIPALVVGLDLTGRVVSFNATAEALTGYRRDEVLGREWLTLALMGEDERQRMRLQFSTLETEGGRAQETIATLLPRDGKPRKIRWSTQPLRAPDGTLNGVVGMGLDVTGQLLLEAQFLQAQKMEPVGALAGGMAHDFNNLLGGILGQAALARAQLAPQDPVQAVLAKVEAAAQRGADLTGKLLAFARKSVIQPQPVDLGALLRETAELLSGSLPREIAIRTEVAPDLPRVRGDSTQLQQVLLNLCVNARDAMPQGGELCLRAAEEPGGWVRVEVADTGVGMSNEVKRHLFEPFFTTKEPGKGTGLGLAVVFGLVRSHGGRVEVESQPGQGTRFLIRLPASAAAPGAPPAVNAPTHESGPSLLPQSLGGVEELLLIDDETIMRETTHQLLAGLGYSVRSVAGGAEALRLLDARTAQPQAVILDVLMPGLAGILLYQELRRRLPKTPVVLISGYSQAHSVQELLQAGALELVQKPFKIEELAAAIRRALRSE